MGVTMTCAAGYRRHWFTRSVGERVPNCVRCGAPNPRVPRNVFTGSYRIVAEPCSQCPWKGRLDLRAGALKAMMAGCREEDAVFVCHMTQRAQDAVSLGDDQVMYPVTGAGLTTAVCAGWMEAMRSQDWRPTALQIVERLDADDRFPPMIERVAPPERSLDD